MCLPLLLHIPYMLITVGFLSLWIVFCMLQLNKCVCVWSSWKANSHKEIGFELVSIGNELIPKSQASFEEESPKYPHQVLYPCSRSNQILSLVISTSCKFSFTGVSSIEWGHVWVEFYPLTDPVSLFSDIVHNVESGRNIWTVLLNIL